MLVIMRKEGESVILTLPDGSRGMVTVSNIKFGNDGVKRIRLGFEFPKEVIVNRLEVQNAVDGIEPQPRPVNRDTRREPRPVKR